MEERLLVESGVPETLEHPLQVFQGVVASIAAGRRTKVEQSQNASSGGHLQSEVGEAPSTADPASFQIQVPE